MLSSCFIHLISLSELGYLFENVFNSHCSVVHRYEEVRSSYRIMLTKGVLKVDSFHHYVYFFFLGGEVFKSGCFLSLFLSN